MSPLAPSPIGMEPRARGGGRAVPESASFLMFGFHFPSVRRQLCRQPRCLHKCVFWQQTFIDDDLHHPAAGLAYYARAHGGVRTRIVEFLSLVGICHVEVPSEEPHVHIAANDGAVLLNEPGMELLHQVMCLRAYISWVLDVIDGPAPQPAGGRRRRPCRPHSRHHRVSRRRRPCPSAQ